MQDTKEPEVEEEIADEAEPQEEEELQEQESEEPESKKAEEPESEDESAEDSEQDEGEEETEGDDEGEIVISFEGEKTEEDVDKSAPKWVKDLRKQNREQAREIKKLQAQIKESSEKKDQTIELGKKPELGDEGIDHDPDKLVEATLEWHKRKQQLDEQAAAKKKRQEEVEQAYHQKLQNYHQGKTSLKAEDFEDAEETVRDALNQSQQSILVQYSNEPAKLVYALGKSPAKLKELSQIKDPILFDRKIRELEQKMNVSRRKPPPPEKVLKGNSGAMTKSLADRIAAAEARAEKTGDRTEVIKLKREQAQKLKPK